MNSFGEEILFGDVKAALPKKRTNKKSINPPCVGCCIFRISRISEAFREQFSSSHFFPVFTFKYYYFLEVSQNVAMHRCSQTAKLKWSCSDLKHTSIPWIQIYRIDKTSFFCTFYEQNSFANTQALISAILRLQTLVSVFANFLESDIVSLHWLT